MISRLEIFMRIRVLKLLICFWHDTVKRKVTALKEIKDKSTIEESLIYKIKKSWYCYMIISLVF